MKFKKLIKEIQSPGQLFMKIIYHYPNLLKWIDDEKYLRICYRITIGKKLNLKDPKLFNEKLQWLKLYDRKDIYTTMVDKYEAKKYVEKSIGVKYIIPTLGVWDNFDDINFDKLPNKFVLKCTHDSGGLVICKDKDNFDIISARKKINRSLKRNFYWVGREWPYKNVKPRIIAEQYMEESENSDLKDYKFYCFNGKVKLFLIIQDRRSNTTGDYFDENNNYVKIDWGFSNADNIPKLPKNINQMKKLAEKLSIGKAELRVDFYNIDEKIYFGELTFFDGSGFEKIKPEKYNQLLGEWIDLSIVKRNY